MRAALVLAAAAAIQTAAPSADPVLDEATRARAVRLSPLPPLPSSPTNAVADDPAAAALGHFLFFDPRLSRDGTLSCASCHVPEQGFSDGRSLSQGVATGRRRTPSLWNAAYQRWFFWDGRADSLWSQALGPLEEPTEMGSDRLAILHVVRRDPELAEAYEAVFGELPPLEDGERFPPHARPGADGEGPVARAWDRMREEDRFAVDRAFANLGKAFEAYERKLVRADAPFDRFVEGLADGDPKKLAALSDSARRGLALFTGRARCVLCHAGPSFTDFEFHNTQAPPVTGGDPEDPGRYEGARRLAESPFRASGPHSDARYGAAALRVESLRQTSESWGAFRTPSLRNLGSGPFMHQGQFATLPEVLEFYSSLEGATGQSHHQEQILVPLRLDQREVHDLLSFLDSLAGELPDARWLSPPPDPRVPHPAGAGSGHSETLARD